MNRIATSCAVMVSIVLLAAGCGSGEPADTTNPVGVPGLRAGERDELDENARRFMDFVGKEKSLPTATNLIYSGGCREVDAGGLHCVIQWRNDEVRGDAIGRIAEDGTMSIRTAAEQDAAGSGPVADPTKPATP